MSTSVNTILTEARKYLGVTQNSPTHKSIVDTYNSVKPLPVGYPVKYSDDWCDAFITYLAIKTGSTDIIGRECGVQRHIDIFKSKGIWIEDGRITPKPGDIITFAWSRSTQGNDNWADHIGIVETVSGNTITTIEGNYDRKVQRRTIPVGWGYIRGYARPKYTESTPSTPTTNNKIPKPVIIDLSEWQVPSSINYDTLAKNIDGVIVRVQYGSAHEDKHYKTHIREFQKRNIPVGVYAWIRGINKADMEKEATDFYNRAKGFKPTFWWLDIEEKSMNDMRAGSEAYRAKLQSLGVPKDKIGAYIGNHLFKSFNIDISKFNGLWIPSYGTNSGIYEGVNPNSTDKYDLHQYTDKGKLGGYGGALDLNRLVDAKKFKQFFDTNYKVVAPKPTAPKKTIDQLAQEVIDGKHGSGDARKKSLGSQYDAVQKRVNEKLNPKPVLKPIGTIAKEVIDNKWGSGEDRIKRLRAAGYNPTTVQNEVNKILKPKKSNNVIADEVIANKWGSGDDRIRRLKAAGYNPTTIQNLVNQKLKPKKTPQQVAREIYLGQGNWGTGQTRVNKLRAAGYNPTEVQRLVNRM